MLKKFLLVFMSFLFVLVASPPLGADSWTPWYTLSQPTTPPGGAGWTQWTEYIELGYGQYIWIGAQNIYLESMLKQGHITIDVADTGDGGYYYVEGRELAVGGQPDGEPRPASWDDSTKTYFTQVIDGFPQSDSFFTTTLDFWAFPQCGWEWVKFLTHGIGGSPVIIYDISIDTTCVPIPGTVFLFGPGLLGLVAMRKRFRKS